MEERLLKLGIPIKKLNSKKKPYLTRLKLSFKEILKTRKRLNLKKIILLTYVCFRLDSMANYR